MEGIPDDVDLSREVYSAYPNSITVYQYIFRAPNPLFETDGTPIVVNYELYDDETEEVIARIIANSEGEEDVQHITSIAEGYSAGKEQQE